MNRYEIAIGKEPSPEDVSLDYQVIETRIAKTLDSDAKLFGLERNENESDQQLRERIMRTLYGSPFYG